MKIKTFCYEDGTIGTIVPEHHMFMGKQYFYGKIVSMFGNSFKKGKGLGNMMKMMMFSQLMGSNNGNNTNGLGGLGQMMAMSMFMGGNKTNPFDGMFDFNLDVDEENEADSEEIKDK